jgi:hypothetical protein
MNIKSAVIIEIEKGGKIYQFIMPMGAPLGEAYDAAFEVLRGVVDMSRQAMESAKPEHSSSSGSGD